MVLPPSFYFGIDSLGGENIPRKKPDEKVPVIGPITETLQPGRPDFGERLTGTSQYLNQRH